MSTLALGLPVGAEPLKTADAKVNTAFTAIQTWANGNIEAENMAAATAKAAGLNRGSEKVKGASTVVAEQETTSTSFVTLTTPDEVTVVLPSEGLISVRFQATWKESVVNAARAAIFVGATQLKVVSGTNTAPVVQEATGQGTNVFVALASDATGLSCAEPSAGYTGDVTTGQAVGAIIGSTIAGGPCDIFAAAGTYAVSVQFKCSSGNVKVKSRKLWVEAKAFS